MSKNKIDLTFGGSTHSFLCVANQNPLVRVFIDTSPGAMILANRISEQFRAAEPSNDGTRITARLSLPVPALINGSDSGGYVPTEKSVGQNRAIITCDISKFSSPEQVEEFVDALQAYVASAEYRAMLVSQLMC